MNRSSIPQYLTLVAVLGLGGVVAYDHLHRPEPAAPATPDAVAVGRSQMAAEATIAADAWERWAAAIEQGKSMQDATADRQKSLHDNLDTSFRNLVGPTLSGLVPEGGEPADAAKRAALVKFGRDMAAGNRKAVGK